jgi:hypothetical protein
MSVTRDECLRQWDGLWQLAARVAGMEHVEGDEPSREPLQLMVGALVYHRKALGSFSDATLHDPVRQDPTLLTDLLSVPGAGLLDAATDARPVIGGIHLASAALRLPTAIFETLDARPAAQGPFAALLRRDPKNGPYDWDRGKCSAAFDDPAIGDDCGGRALSIQTALILMLLFREDFGHGEEGKGPIGSPGREKWIKGRSGRLSEARRCRVFEAQRLLVQWGLSALEQPR